MTDPQNILLSVQKHFQATNKKKNNDKKYTITNKARP